MKFFLSSLLLNIKLRSSTLTRLFYEVSRVTMHSADSVAILEDFSNLRVHLYIHIISLSTFDVSFLDLLIDPICECFSHNCVDDIGKVLSWEFANLCLDHW